MENPAMTHTAVQGDEFNDSQVRRRTLLDLLAASATFSFSINDNIVSLI